MISRKLHYVRLENHEFEQEHHLHTKGNNSKQNKRKISPLMSSMT